MTFKLDELFIFSLIIVSILAFTSCGELKGPSGADGKVGEVGPPGASIPVFTRPAFGFECENGGSVISVGTTQTVICNGLNGNQGSPGQDATPVSLIRFCPGFTPMYPEVFAEYGICVDSQLYGVYSQNGGFLALLPPGLYKSDGINADCTFTVLANCVIRN